ncbi:MAG: hypothetical protein Q8O67_23960 [Deltaproteobacteria bacterium]|nr:hypothetical protein [Deltaproteobacteria bacterium]
MNTSVKSFALALVLLPTLLSCDSPVHPRNQMSSAIDGICDFSFDCCLPQERGQLAFFASSTKDGCKEELEALLGGFASVNLEAVERGTAIFDAEAAERCTKERRAAADQCDARPFVTSTGEFDLTSLAFFVDPRDAECAALTARSFTRGTVKDGGDCIASVECADFGTCIVEDRDGDDVVITVAGKCQATLKDGDSCVFADDEDERACEPGTNCDGDTCEAPELLDDGAACGADSQCDSGLCSGLDQEGVCDNNGDFCEIGFDEDCLERGFCFNDLCDDGVTACVEDFECDVEGTCAGEGGPPTCKTITINIEICDGL